MFTSASMHTLHMRWSFNARFSSSRLFFSENRRKYHFIKTIGALIVLFLLALLAGMFYKRRSNRLILDLKTQELLVEKQSNISQEGRLKELQETIAVQHQEIRKIKNEEVLLEDKQDILAKLSTTKKWEEFVVEFMVIHKPFVDRIKQHHPNLSIKDFRLISLIRQGLSDKEIANMLFIDYGSVRKSKSRLKLKMGLPIEDSVNTYILSI